MININIKNSVAFDWVARFKFDVGFFGTMYEMFLFSGFYRVSGIVSFGEKSIGCSWRV